MSLIRKKIIDNVKKRLEKELKTTERTGILVALSGGADSVCLLYALNTLKQELNFDLYAAHLNHCLRGEAAKNDENFAKDFCKKLDIELFARAADVREYAKEHKLSEELAGRELRYSFFDSVMKEKNIRFLATGHHGDDQAETVLMHLMRGSGIEGISGMKYKRDNIIRPLLFASKKEILQFCKEENLEFCTDATNFETEYSRNKVRLELLPEMNKFNPGLSGTICRTAELLGDDSDFLNLCAEDAYKKSVCENSVRIQDLEAFHIAIRRRIIKKMIEDAAKTKKDITYDYIDKVLSLADNKKTGKSINLLNDVIARVQYDKIVIEKHQTKYEFSYNIFPEKELFIPQIHTKIRLSLKENGDFIFPADAKFIARTRMPGDRIYPPGISGSKKLKDYFIDKKVPRQERDQSLIITCNDEIVLVCYGDKTFYDRRFYKKHIGGSILEIEKRQFKE